MNCKRLGIFLCFDQDGIIDDYIVFMLKSMETELEDLVIVSNGALSQDGRKKLSQFSDKIIERGNTGFDVGGWQDAIVNHCGFEMLRKYTELVLFNDSFFGPFYPFREVFSNINDDTDFWGLSVHGETGNIFGMCPYGYRPRYLQTYFLVIREKMLHSAEFESYWKNLPEFHEFNEVGERFSCVFTKYFSDLGYKWQAYSDTSDLESTREKAMSFHTFNTYDMLVNRKFPIIKRKTFITSKDRSLRYNYGGELSRAMRYIKENTDYDTNLIYKYLLRKYNLEDLKNSLNWNLILPEEERIGTKLYQDKTVAVIAHLFYPDLFSYCLKYLLNVKDMADIYITTDTEEKKATIEKMIVPALGERVHVILVNARGRDLSALLVGCKKYLMEYDYLCFIHDKKSSQKEFPTVGTSFCDLLWENTLKSRGFVHNILNEFEKEECLGLLVPPSVYHGTYYHSSLNYWTICYDKTIEIANMLGIKANIAKEKSPIAVGTVFWCKTKALKDLFETDFDYMDFPGEPLPNDGSISHALERLIPYVAQHHGYYTETLANCEYMQVEDQNYRYMLNDTIKNLSKMKGFNFSTHQHLIKSINARAKDNPSNSMGADPQLVEIGLKRALQNYIKKKFRFLDKNNK